MNKKLTKIRIFLIFQCLNLKAPFSAEIEGSPLIKKILPAQYDSSDEYHDHFGQAFGGHMGDGALMGPMNWQARSSFSLGNVRSDGVRSGGLCCGDTCRNGGIGCCGRCPHCIDCPYKK